MMTRPAGATGAVPIPAAAPGATPNEASWAIGTDSPASATGADAPPFTLALLALTAAADSAGAPVSPAAAPVPKTAGTAPTDTAARFALATAVVTEEQALGAMPIQPASPAQPLPVGTSSAGATHVTADTPDPQPAVAAGSSALAKAAVRSAQSAEAQVLPRDVLRSLFVADAAGSKSHTAATAGAKPAVITPTSIDPTSMNPAGVTTTGMQLTGMARVGAAGTAADRPAAASNGAQGKGKTKSDRATQPAPSANAPSDAGAALLATVLQWTQQLREPAPDAHPGADAAHPGFLADGTDSAAPIAATAISASGIDTAPARQSSTRARAPRLEVAAAIGLAGSAATARLTSATAMTPAGDEVAGVASPDTGLPLVTPPGTATAGAHAAIDEHPHASPGVASDTVATGAPADASNGADMAAALRAAGAAGAHAASAAPVERNIAVPVHERHWPAALATQVLILSSDKLQAATLRLTPEHLGPVEVHIDMHDTQVNVNFTAAHAETRAALEQAMPQLRAVLAGAGLTLGQASVQQQTRRESQNSAAATRLAGAANDAPEVTAVVARARGMIDEFA